MQTAPKKIINAWAMYDWANSSYNLVITATIFPAYYVGITTRPEQANPSEVGFFGFRFVNTALIDYALGLVFLIVAICSPILSSFADYRRNKKLYLQWFSLLGASCCSLLFFFLPGRVEYGVILYSLAALGFWSSLVFYNSYLPDIAAPEDRDRVSAKGFALGYIGSVILQIICFLIIINPGWFGLSAADKTLGPRISFLLVGLWWYGFAQITLRAMPTESRNLRKLKTNVIVNGFRELRKVWIQIRETPSLGRFLLSFFLYSVGVQTVFLVATGFGKKEIFPHPDDEPKLLLTIIIIQLVAIPGAILMSRLSKRIGNLWVLILTVLIWSSICLAGYLVETQTQFYALAAVTGLVMGGIQSMSRSTYAKLLPETPDTTSFFSFYDVTEKIALALGLFLFAYLEELTGSMRNSILALMVFFILGLVALFYTKAITTKENYAALYH